MILRAIQPGADLLEGLTALGQTGEGWVSGTGHVEAVELRVAGEDADPVRVLRGRLTMVQLSGPAAGPFSVTLARASDVGIEVLGGVLVRARSAGVSLVFQTMSTSVASPARPAGTAGARPEPSVASGAEGAGGSVWAVTALASARARARDAAEIDEGPMPEAGDLVEHFAFGRCEVLTADGDRLRIRDIDGPQRIREVSLSMLKVSGPTDSDGKRLFQLTRKSPGG
jgi:hypothetical protein